MVEKREVISQLQTGDTVQLEEMLDSREMRAVLQQRYLTDYSKQTLVALKLNIPGEIKQNNLLEQLFEIGVKDIESTFQSHSLFITMKDKRQLKTGNEAYWLIHSEPEKVKRVMVDIEKNTPLGRLYDIDVMYHQAGKMRTVKRNEIQEPVRQCFVCLKNAKDCARNQTHTKAEIYDAIAEMIIREKRVQ